MIPLGQEIVFAGSMVIVATLIHQIVQRLPPAKALALVGTALMVFVFRAVPLPGAGATWSRSINLDSTSNFCLCCR